MKWDKFHPLERFDYKIKRIGFTLACLFAGCLISKADTPYLDFSISLSSYDPGATYVNLHSGSAGNINEYVVGFQLNVTSVNGGAGFASPLAGFCSEQVESVSGNTPYRFDIVPLEHVSSGRAGEYGTASYLIPAGGIGDLRAARVRYLFDNYYQSSTMSDWTGGPSTFQAFQLALWETTHDNNLDLKTPSPNGIYVAVQNDPGRDGAINLAQAMLDSLKAANVTPSYESAKVNVWGLASIGKQDLMLGIPIILVPETQAVEELVPVPEPVGLSLLAVGGSLLLSRRRHSHLARLS